MRINLPDPDRRQLSKSPLNVVVCQLRYETNLAVTDAKVAVALHKALGGRQGSYPRLEQVHSQGINVALKAGAEAAVSSAGSLAGWRFSSSNNDWVATVMPDHVALETSAFTTWEEDFRPRLQQLLDIVAEHVEPAIEERLGLRYIDHVHEASVDSPADWSRAVRSELLGPVLHEGLAPAVTASRQELALEIDDDCRCTLRHGFVPADDQPPTYLLDYDIYREDSRPFDTSAIMDAANRFNDVALRLFQASLNPDYWEGLL